jgi:branched-subunit amino acid ABC-type transport system permease component
MGDFGVLFQAGIVDGAILAVPAVAFTVQFGVTNQVNSAFAAFVTFGAYAAYTLDSRLKAPFAVTLIVSGMASAFLSLLIGSFVYAPFMRRRPQLLNNLALTFSVWLILENLFVALWGADYRQLTYSSTAGSSSVQFGPVSISQIQGLFLLIAVMTLVAMHVLLNYTRLGRSMRAMSDDHALAVVAGLRTRRITHWAWWISGLLAGIAGFIQANQLRTFDPTIGDTFIYFVFGAAILGGIGRPYGAVIGALIIGLIVEFSVPVIGATLSPVMIFAVLLFLMTVRPNGLFGATGRSHFGGA